MSVLKMARSLNTEGTPQRLVIGINGRVSRIARIHQYGLEDRAERGALNILYLHRELLGLQVRGIDDLRSFILSEID